MELSLDWINEFQQTSTDILQDTLLLEGMVLRMEQTEPYMMAHVPQEELNKSFFRLLNYLSQHVKELYLLHQRLSLEVIDAPATAPG